VNRATESYPLPTTCYFTASPLCTISVHETKSLGLSISIVGSQMSAQLVTKRLLAAGFKSKARKSDVEAVELEEGKCDNSHSKSAPVAPSSSQPRSRKWTELLSQAFRNADYPCITYDDDSNSFGVDLTTLQRLNLYNIQHELVQCVNQMRRAENGELHTDTAFSSDAMANLHALLQRYCEYFFWLISFTDPPAQTQENTSMIIALALV
jgi:hypothetical protein